MSTPPGSCQGPSTVVFDPSLTEYNFGPEHPMAPIRVDLTMRLADQLGILGKAAGQVRLVDAPMADNQLIATVHDPQLIEAVTRMGNHPGPGEELLGLGTDDNPVFLGMHEAAAHVVGASHEAFRQVWTGESLHSANITGGLHHAMRDRASGFCIYNDAALAIRRLLDGGVQRVAYIDVDAHHGDGTQSIFWNDPRVLTISLHETGMTLFPGTGFANEIGGPEALGSAVNVALPAGTSDAGWLRAFHAVVPQLVGAFEPDVIVSQHGCDSHRLDPLTHLNVSVDGQREAATAVGNLAARYCDNRWIATGGGGYHITGVVPRAWSHLIGVAAGRPVPLRTPVPEAWRTYVHERYGISAPALMGDDADVWWRSWEVGFDPNDEVDRTVMATRKEVFPLHGLDPWFD